MSDVLTPEGLVSLINKILELESEIANQNQKIADLQQRLSRSKVRSAQGALREVIAEYGDPTGQDGEYEIEQAVEHYLDEEQAHIRRTDPERYSEMRAFGCFR